MPPCTMRTIMPDTGGYSHWPLSSSPVSISCSGYETSHETFFLPRSPPPFLTKCVPTPNIFLVKKYVPPFPSPVFFSSADQKYQLSQGKI